MQYQGKKKDKRKLVMAIIAGVLALLMLIPILFNVLAAARAVSQSDINALKKDAQELAQEKKQLSAKITSLSKNKAQALEEKKALDQQNAVIQKQIDNTTALIQNYNKLISQKEVELKAAREREAEQYALFCQRVRSMEESGTVSYIAVVFGAKDFSDLLDRINMIQDVMEYDNGIMKELAATRQEIAETKTTLEQSRAEEKQAKAELTERQGELKTQISKAQNLVAQMVKQSAEYEASLAKLAAEEDAISDKIDKMVAELERQMQESGTKIISESGFQWPLNGYRTVTSSFGMRLHPLAGVWRLHTGIDISAPRGTPIHATKSGRVIISAYGSSYGNYVSISHGGGDSSLYAHMSSRAVSAGQDVKQGQVIGYVGSTGSSTGNHLHFEIKINGSRINPLKVF